MKEEDFIKDWKELAEKSKEAGIKINDLFKYYTHVLRAKGSYVRKEIGLRSFYSQENYAKLTKDSPKLMADLFALGEFWSAFYHGEKEIAVEGKPVINEEAQQYLDCLAHYPNDYWKYVTSVFFMQRHSKEDFASAFPKFLKKLTAFLFIKFIQNPTVNAIKDDISKACVQVYHDAQGSENLIFAICYIVAS